MNYKNRWKNWKITVIYNVKALQCCRITTKKPLFFAYSPTNFLWNNFKKLL